MTNRKSQSQKQPQEISSLPSNESRLRLLVIGDWVVDEHWVIGIHRSPTSSRVGHHHFRALHDPQNALQAFCGAGQTASILCRTLLQNHQAFQILGVGVWDPLDTEALTGMLDPNPEKQPSPYRINRSYPHPSVNAQLVNLGAAIKGECKPGTTRVIRIYQDTGAKLELLNRIDWELPIPGNHTVWVGAEGNENQNDSAGIISTDDLNQSAFNVALQKSKIDGVVVKDMHKGVLSSGLIQWLANHPSLAKASWFISTKAWRPSENADKNEPQWLDILQRERANVRLLLIPHVAAGRAVREGALSCWLTSSGVPSGRALKKIKALSEKFPNAITVVLPGGLSIVAAGRRGTDDCFVQTEAEEHLNADEDAVGIGVPMNSVFFSACIARMMTESGTLDIESVLKPALHFTHEWMVQEVERIRLSEQKKLNRQFQLKLDESIKPTEFEKWKPYKVTAITHEWQQAFKECGIIEDNNGKRCIQLWRAMTDVKGYICCVPSKRESIQRILRLLSSFKASSQHHRSCMIQASPGSGKTHFVRQLAKSMDLSALQFNITQMLSKRDILDCFDTIVTTQAQNPDKQLLVFIDEINASLDNQHVYDAFLAPIGEGIYVRGGKTFHMVPCAWLFAGTENPTNDIDKSTKGSDFVSRLSISMVNFQIASGQETELATERVYLGVSLLKSTFPDVRRVSEKVLRMFQFLREDVEIRQIEHLVKSFSDIQHGQVNIRNVPTERFQNLTTQDVATPHHYFNWTQLPDDLPLVEIQLH